MSVSDAAEPATERHERARRERDAAERVLLQIENLEQFIIPNIDTFLPLGKAGLNDLLQELESFKHKLNRNTLTVVALEEINTLLRKAEDDIDSIIYPYARWKTANILLRRLFIKKPQNLKEQIISVKEATNKLWEIDQKMVKVDLDDHPTEDISETSACRGKEDSVVALDNISNEVIQSLIGGPADLQVISIVGVAGLGKTTLARQVLEDPKIKEEFPTRKFVPVSENYQRKEVFRQILGCLTSQQTNEADKMSEDELATHLRKQLETRKYLIVMDDVRKREDWDQLKVAFSKNKEGSRVLMTTRKKHVAAHANPAIKPHYLCFLKSTDSRELLRRKIFGGNNCPKELQGYELLIATKCDGLPLAIDNVANGLLKDPGNSNWWEKVAESLNDYIPSYSSKDLILRSYEHLPYRLKLCFLYLGMLPRDFEIPVWKLVRLWIAEGFIPSEGAVEMEDRAEKYLEELVGRNLVLVGKRSSDGRIRTCRIYEPLRHFCKMEAAEENLFQEIEMANQSGNLHGDHPRRLCINSYLLDFFTGRRSYVENIRSFLAFTSEETTLRSTDVDFFLKTCRVLRVLVVKSMMISHHLPVHLAALYFLKYLAISCESKILPRRMSSLLSIQTIIIGTTSSTFDIHSDIWGMRQLRHLHVNASTCLPAPLRAEVAENANLQTLSFISPECWGEDVVKMAPKLRKLGIRGKIAVLFESDDRFGCISKLEYLENLKLVNDDDVTSSYFLPPASNFPRKLTKLTLSNTGLTWDQISKLGQLKNLEVLKIKDDAFRGEIWQTESVGFLRLKVLHIGAKDLMMWKASAEHFPVLECLVLRHCHKLRALPLGLSGIPRFQRIDLYDTNSSVVSSATEIQSRKQEGHTGSNGFYLSVYPPDQ